MIPFRDDDQRQRACRTLLAEAGLADLWTAAGPTDAAQALLASGASDLPRGERVVLLAAWALWTTGRPPALPLGDLVGVSEAEPLANLIIASLYGPDAIDVWLTRPRREGYASGEHETREAASRLFDEARACLAENGADAINFAAAPDACALGACQMADYAMIVGIDVVDDDQERHRRAIELAVRALGMFATLSAQEGTQPPAESA
jgi:hypothetical protein